MNPASKPTSLADYAMAVACAAAPIIVLLIGMQSDMPYGYYVLLRFVVFAGGLTFSAIFSGMERHNLQLYFFGLMILYNPFFPVYLPREKWLFIDAITIGSFVIGCSLWVASLRKNVGADFSQGKV